MSSDAEPVTEILLKLEEGDLQASDQLFQAVYDELRRMAGARMSGEAAGHTLDGTALVHEAYVRLVDSQRVHDWNSRGHFFAAAAEAMRRILIDHARRKKSQKRGGEMQRVDLDDAATMLDAPHEDLLSIDQALQDFEAIEPEKAKLVRLRFFAGLSASDASSVLAISKATADRWWAFSRAWLYSRLDEE